jgi:P27 family predicted phage terminase small subunit
MSHRKPTALKLLENTFRKDRAPKREPRPKAGLPGCPTWLDARGRAKWRQLVPLLDGMRVLTKGDGDVLALACDAFARYRDARDAVREHGSTYESPTPAGGTIVRPRPEVQMADVAWRQYVQALIQFGLTPAARSRVTAEAPADSDPAGSFLFGASARTNRGA